jgi:quinol monooxygenase YgiN
MLLTRFDAVGLTEADRFVERLETVRAGIDSESGSLSYRIFRDATEPTVMFVLEEWATEAAANAHIRRSGEGESAEAVLKLLSTPPATSTIIER